MDPGGRQGKLRGDGHARSCRVTPKRSCRCARPGAPETQGPKTSHTLALSRKSAALRLSLTPLSPAGGLGGQQSKPGRLPSGRGAGFGGDMTTDLKPSRPAQMPIQPGCGWAEGRPDGVGVGTPRSVLHGEATSKEAGLCWAHSINQRCFHQCLYAEGGGRGGEEWGMPTAHHTGPRGPPSGLPNQAPPRMLLTR